jgi:hypothetical protein
MIRTPGRHTAAAVFAAASLALASAQALAQGEAAVTKRAVELRETPAESAKSLGSLAAQSPVTRLAERQGPWVQVRTAAGATGWVHMFELAPAQGAGSAGGATGVLRGVTGLFTRGAGQPTTSATSTIGIRGLEAEDLNNSQPNVPAVTQMEGLRQSESQARDFGRSANLKTAPVDPLPAPERPRPAATDPAASGQIQ